MHATVAHGTGLHPWTGVWRRLRSSSLALAVAAAVAALALLSSFYQVVDGAVERAALKRAAAQSGQAIACRPLGKENGKVACDVDLVLARLP